MEAPGQRHLVAQISGVGQTAAGQCTCARDHRVVSGDEQWPPPRIMEAGDQPGARTSVVVTVQVNADQPHVGTVGAERCAVLWHQPRVVVGDVRGELGRWCGTVMVARHDPHTERHPCGRQRPQCGVERCGVTVVGDVAQHEQRVGVVSGTELGRDGDPLRHRCVFELVVPASGRCIGIRCAPMQIGEHG